jgi:hypothetical protein
MQKKHQKNRTTLAYRIWSVTGYEEKLSLLDRQPRFTWVARFIEGVVEFFTAEDEPPTKGCVCRECGDASHRLYALSMYARTHFGQRKPNVSVYA